MKIIVGLGNTGLEYVRTRHNIGFRILDACGMDFRVTKKFHADIAKKEDIIFCKPQTMMNNSGQAVQTLLAFYHCAPSDMLLIYDDKDLPFGRIRVRAHGSSGGHNGVQSVIDALGTTDFARLRVGIAGTHAIQNTAAYVLRNFTKTEERDLSTIIKNASDVIQQFIISKKPPAHQDIAIKK